MKLNDFTVDMMGQADRKSNIQDEISYRKSTIEGNKYDEVTVARMKAELETYELALKYDINYIFYYNSYWRKLQPIKEILILVQIHRNLIIVTWMRHKPCDSLPRYYRHL